MMTRKRIAIMLVFALLLSLVPFSVAFAATEDMTARIQVLEADPNSDLVLNEVSAVVYPDGRISVKTGGTKKAGTPEIAYDVIIDLQKGTYKTELLTSTDKPNASVEKSYGIMSAGTYEAQVRLVTRDPVFIELASTKNRLRWTVNSNGTVSWNQYSYTYSAANPSPFNTHWYVTWTSDSPPRYNPTYTLVETECYAEYHNWDFMDVNKSTHAWHNVLVRGRNDGYFNYSAHWLHWGEASLLLHGRVFVN